MIIFNKKCFLLGVIIQIITIIIALLPRLWFDLASAILYGVVYSILIITGLFFFIGGYQDNESIMYVGIFLLIGAVFALVSFNYWGESYWVQKFGQDTVFLIKSLTEYIEQGWDFEEYILPVVILLSSIPNSIISYHNVTYAHIILGTIAILLGIVSYFSSRKEKL
ncbi:MAG: hypothetical protein ACTSRG_17180 [Candidatus Helarchaeota archaeon]